TDAFDLQRFVNAQSTVYSAVTEELRRGRKTTHWMWFVFPQLRGLGQSAMAQRYAISSLDEARAYLAHPVLGRPLRECVRTRLDPDGLTAHEVFGSPDDLKLRSCLTLFERAAPGEPAFAQAIDKYFGGLRDPLTTSRT